MITNKVRYIPIQAQLIAEIMKRAIENKVPKDTEVLRVNLDPLSNNFNVVIYSKEFDEIKEGELIPKHPEPTITDNCI